MEINLKSHLFAYGTACAGDEAMEQQIVSIEKMKSALAQQVGSKFPIKITTRDGEAMIRYVRGFADHQSDILLISETSYKLALKIIEIKDIRKIEYSPEGEPGKWKVLIAKWMKKPMNPLVFVMGSLGMLVQFFRV